MAVPQQAPQQVEIVMLFEDGIGLSLVDQLHASASDVEAPPGWERFSTRSEHSSSGDPDALENISVTVILRSQTQTPQQFLEGIAEAGSAFETYYHTLADLPGRRFIEASYPEE